MTREGAPRKLRRVLAWLIAAGIVGAAVGLLAVEKGVILAHAETARELQPAAKAIAALPDFSGPVSKQGPAVVNISVTEKEKKVRPLIPEARSGVRSSILRARQRWPASNREM